MDYSMSVEAAIEANEIKKEFEKWWEDGQSRSWWDRLGKDMLEADLGIARSRRTL